MIRHNVLGRISSIHDDLPNAEKKISEVILASPEEAVNMTASELGKAAGSSAATVIRLCKRIGIPSFTQLKVLISGEIKQTNTMGYSDIKKNEHTEDIMDKLLGNAFQSMQDTISILDRTRLNQAIEALEKAQVIYVFGIGASHLVAQNIAQKWSRIGKTCICTADAHNLVAAFAIKNKHAVFIGISNSGETKEISKLIDIANDSGYTTISLTRFGDNEISSKSAIPLNTVRANEEELRSAATSSLHAQFIVVDVLFFIYASRNYNSVMKSIQQSRSQIETYAQD